MPSALLEPSQLQLPPQPEDFFRVRLGYRHHKPQPPLPDIWFVKFITDIS